MTWIHGVLGSGGDVVPSLSTRMATMMRIAGAFAIKCNGLLTKTSTDFPMMASVGGGSVSSGVVSTGAEVQWVAFVQTARANTAIRTVVSVELVETLVSTSSATPFRTRLNFFRGVRFLKRDYSKLHRKGREEGDAPESRCQQ